MVGPGEGTAVGLLVGLNEGFCVGFTVGLNVGFALHDRDKYYKGSLLPSQLFTLVYLSHPSQIAYSTATIRPIMHF